VTDQGLPGMTGLELAKRARAEKRAAEVVMVSSMPSPEAVVQALDAGARAWLLKPVDGADRLRRAVRAAVARDRLRQLVSGLGGELRPWADRALAVARGAGASRQLLEALELLSRRPEGPARLGVVGERALVGPLAMAGHRAEGPWDLTHALTAASSGAVEALVIGEGVEPGAAREFVRMAAEVPWTPAILWAQPPGSYAEALELLEAGVVEGVVARPVDGAALSQRTSRIVEARRNELRAVALGVVLAELGVDAPPETAAA